MEEDERRATALDALTGGEDTAPAAATPPDGSRPGGDATGDGKPDAAAPARMTSAIGLPHDEAADDDDMPRLQVTTRQSIAFGAFILSIVAFLYFVLPKISGPNGLGQTWHRIEHGDEWWLLLAVLFEMLSFAGYIALFRAVFVRGYGRIGWAESYEITMAGLAASRVFATAGAGGIALTAWALGRSGMPPRVVACRMVAFLVLLYLVYALALLLDGIGLGTGLLPGGGSFAITFIPAIVAAGLLAFAGAVAFLPRDVERRLQRWAQGSGRLAGWLAGAVSVPATGASGVRTAIDLVRTRDPYLLGAPAWWGFDICVLWASFHAFGSAPPFPVIVMAYFIGMLGNLLPLPGGVGGVDGGMIGAFAAFGVNFNLAVVAVLVYRAIAFWLPTIPGRDRVLPAARHRPSLAGRAAAEGAAAEQSLGSQVAQRVMPRCSYTLQSKATGGRGLETAGRVTTRGAQTHG